MVISGVKIFTMEDSVIDNGYVIIKDGKISAVGAGEPDTELIGGDEVIRENGWMFPGLIDGHTHIGLIEDSLTFEGDDINESSDPSTPQMRGIDAVNPMDRCFTEALSAGVTCVGVGPGSANPVGGQFSVIKTYGKRIDRMIVKSPSSMKFALGENPKNVYHGKNQAPETRMATSSIIREALKKAQKYAEDVEKFKNANDDDEIDEPEYDAKNDALLPLLNGEIPAHFHAHRADDIFTAIRIAKEFGLKYKIIHCTEGHLVAEELADEGVEAFVGPNLSDRSKPELVQMTFANAGILDRAGLLISITTDHPVTPLKYLTLCAALAVKEGLNRESAYKALTINPAKILGVDDRIGSIAIGKDADLVIFTGDPLDIFTDVSSVYINGKRVVKSN